MNTYDIDWDERTVKKNVPQKGNKKNLYDFFLMNDFFSRAKSSLGITFL